MDGFTTPYCIMYIVYSDKSLIVIALGFSKTNTIGDTYQSLIHSMTTLLRFMVQNTHRVTVNSSQQYDTVGERAKATARSPALAAFSCYMNFLF